MLLINKNNIEYRKSIYIGKSKDGDVMKMRIDKLTVVSDLNNRKNKNSFIDAIQNIKSDKENFLP
ncbi:hypothetical protein AE07_04194 [Enterobacter cloacae BWH 43]|nr:hypothetical protein AE07_04194 [Enterobacter cloacae BWH 43]